MGEGRLVCGALGGRGACGIGTGLGGGDVVRVEIVGQVSIEGAAVGANVPAVYSPRCREVAGVVECREGILDELAGRRVESGDRLVGRRRRPRHVGRPIDADLVAVVEYPEAAGDRESLEVEPGPYLALEHSEARADVRGGVRLTDAQRYRDADLEARSLNDECDRAQVTFSGLA